MIHCAFRPLGPSAGEAAQINYMAEVRIFLAAVRESISGVHQPRLEGPLSVKSTLHPSSGMIVKTLFKQNGYLEAGWVEVKLLPGIPQLHIVGLPDAGLREAGIKLKSALRSAGFDWPKGQQIVVSLRPVNFRKGGAGADLAIALAYLAITDQLSKEVRTLLEDSYVYGEVALNGDVLAPADLSQAIRAARSKNILTGALQTEVREGRWTELARLNDSEVRLREKVFDWDSYWQRPELEEVSLHEKAAQALMLSLHMELNVLVAGPQGSGKSTWGRLLHGLTQPPDVDKMRVLAEQFGDEVLDSRWRPLEQPHHTITPIAMIGGGLPLVPGVISRAHGGVLLMDEFLEFHSSVIEALREPVEAGYVELARKGSRERFPARFQLIGTTNLCRCGKLQPGKSPNCVFNLLHCRAVTARLSGPILDRFDLLALSHEWLSSGRQVSLAEIREKLERALMFRANRKTEGLGDAIGWVNELGVSHRRRKSILKVARGLADLEESEYVLGPHRMEAFDLVVTPMLKIREVFG
jgi:magnesium chelatase family protein